MELLLIEATEVEVVAEFFLLFGGVTVAEVVEFRVEHK